LGFIKNRLFWLIIIAFSVRIIFGFFYPVKSVPDTGDYFRTGMQFVEGDYSDYIGARPPVYPLLIAATNFDKSAVNKIQVVMGVAVSVLLYLIFSGLTKSDNMGFILGLTYALNPSQMLFEFAMMSETTCTFLLILTIYLLFRLFNKPSAPSWIEYVSIGVVSSLCVLTRGQFQPFPVLIAFFLAYHLKIKAGERLWKLSSFLIPVVILLCSWASFQYIRLGQFTLNPSLGYSLTAHTVNFIESAPEDYREIKEILISHRDYNLRTKGTEFNAVAASVPEILKVTGNNYMRLYRVMKEMNREVIIKEPWRYLKSVAKSGVQFYKPTWYGRLLGIRDVINKGEWTLKIIAALYAVLHVLFMFVFLVFPLITVFSKRLGTTVEWSLSTVFIYILVLITGTSAAFVEIGENARYKTSVEPLIICLAVWIMMELYNDFKGALKKELNAPG
jgi:hypothetical protein